MRADTLPLQTHLRTRHEALRARIDAAARRAGRDPSAVTLIAVSKTFPLALIRAAVEAGLRDFGENRVQELDEKAQALPGHAMDPASPDPIRWHHIGSLQRNKARTVCEVADVFHALDSPRLARELDTRARAVGRVLPCLVQVNVSGEASKSGLAPEDTLAFVDSLAAYEHLRPVGLMTLAAPTRTEEELESVVRPQFQRLRRLAEAAGRDRLPALSMGMSGDFEVAVEEGATHVRIGSALFGARG
ncbi:MAG: YggS family pyridoxal phosphate-dependent enzyme [Bacteroidota bacterium]